MSDTIKPVAWMHDQFAFLNFDHAAYDDERNRRCGFKPKPIIPLYTADAIEALLAERGALIEHIGTMRAEREALTVERDRLREELAAAKDTIRTQESMVDDREALAEKLHAAERDAERYRWLRGKVTEELVRPEHLNSEWPDLRTKWEFPFLYCSGPVGGYNSFDAAIDAAMGEQP